MKLWLVFQKTAFDIAVQNGNTEVISFLLKSSKINFNCKNVKNEYSWIKLIKIILNDIQKEDFLITFKLNIQIQFQKSYF